MITLIKLQAIFGEIAPKAMKQVFSDWQMMVGVEATAQFNPIRIVKSADVVSGAVGDQHVVVETLVRRGSGDLGAILFAFSNEMVVEIIGEVLMIPESAKEEKARSGLSENDVETFQEMANLLCGSWNRVFQDGGRELRISQSVDDLRVSPTVGSRKALLHRAPEGRLASMEMAITMGTRSYSGLIVLPFNSAIAVAEAFSEPGQCRAD